MITPVLLILNMVGVIPVLNTNGCENEDDPFERFHDSEIDSDVLIVNVPPPCADTVA
jgi:hypothetical protein